MKRDKADDLLMIIVVVIVIAIPLAAWKLYDILDFLWRWVTVE